MYDIIRVLDGWNEVEDRAVVARTVALHGFGARTVSEALVIAASGSIAGSLLGGTADAQLRTEAASLLGGPDPATRIVRVEVGDDDAVAAGFVEGGDAVIVLQSASLLRPDMIEAFRTRSPLAVASVLGGSQVLAVNADGAVTGALAPAELRQAAIEAARQLLDAAISASRVVVSGGTQILVECFIPTTRLLVVGRGMLGEALAAQAKLLRWTCTVLDDNDQASAAREIRDMRGSDALVLLTHNFQIDAPIIGAAIRRHVGYVGALGSRLNQIRRRERLVAYGLTEEELARVRGPIGLDIGPANPAETALAICSEALAVLHDRSAEALTGISTPLSL